MNKQISHKSVLVWRVWLTMLAIPLFFFCGILMAFSLFWGGLIFLACAILYLFAVLYYLPHRYHSITYSVTPSRLELQKGVFAKNIFRVEFDSIIYTKSTQTPLQRLLKLCTLQLHPIGRAAVLPHLPLADAELLLNTIEETSYET